MVIGAIIALIIFALVVGVNAYYGGDSVNESAVKAEAVKSISEGEQISTMIQLFKFNEGTSPSDLTSLTSDTYYNRTQSNMGWSFDSASGIAYKQMKSDQFCEAANKEIGYEGAAPSCSSVPNELAGKKYYCCVN